MIFNRVSGPSSEPVTLDELRKHINMDEDQTQDDEYLEVNCIPEAREFFEEQTRRAMLSQTWRLKLDSFKTEIRLPRPPLQSVTSITYVDTNGATQTLATGIYVVDTDEKPGVVRLAYGQVWPSVRCERNAVTINYVAGYASVAAIPNLYKRAIKVIAAEHYKSREETAPIQMHEVPFGIRRIIENCKIRTL